MRLDQPLVASAMPNEVWSVDFMSDILNRERRLRTLNIRDEGTRETLFIKIYTSLPEGWYAHWYTDWPGGAGSPRAIQLHNVPKLAAQRFTAWRAVMDVELRHIQLGKPNHNAFIERFNRSYQTEVLNRLLLARLDEDR